jgi:hypothetical protein
MAVRELMMKTRFPACGRSCVSRVHITRHCLLKSYELHLMALGCVEGHCNVLIHVVIIYKSRRFKIPCTDGFMYLHFHLCKK